jgi:hypothetical protein
MPGGPGSGEPLKGGATETSGGMVAARLAGLPHGGDRSSGDFKGSIDPLKTTQEAADVLNVGTAPVKRARAVFTKGTPELAAAVEAGEITVNAASEIDKLPAAHGNSLQLGPREAQIFRSQRQTHSLAVLQQIKTRVDDLSARRKDLPQSLTGLAITYALGQWENPLGFLQDGPVQIDHNLAENTTRPTAIGKKNGLFFGEPKAGDRAAACYTLIGNCHRAGIDAQAYLTHLFTRLATPAKPNKFLHRLTPRGWAADRKSAAQNPPS